MKILLICQYDAQIPLFLQALLESPGWKPSLLKLPSTHHVYCPLGLTHPQPGPIGIGLLTFPFLWLLALEGWDYILLLTQIFD